MSGHTKGPWELEGSWSTQDEELGGWVTLRQSVPLFELSPCCGTRDEVIANARLIAAAPETAAERDIYKEALEAIASGEGFYGAHAHEYKQIARTAISKATGGGA